MRPGIGDRGQSAHEDRVAVAVREELSERRKGEQQRQDNGYAEYIGSIFLADVASGPAATVTVNCTGREPARRRASTPRSSP